MPTWVRAGFRSSNGRTVVFSNFELAFSKTSTQRLAAFLSPPHVVHIVHRGGPGVRLRTFLHCHLGGLEEALYFALSPSLQLRHFDVLPLRVAAPPHLHLRHSLQRRRSLGSHAAEESRHKDSVAGGAKFEGDGGQPFDVKQGLAHGFPPGMAETSVSFTRPPSDPVTLVARIEWWMVGGEDGTPSEDLARRNGGKSSPWFFNPAK